MELFEEFSQFVDEFKNEKIEHALCGGLAMGVYTFPRATLGIDILIEPETLEKAKSIAKKLGFTFDAGLMRLSGQDHDDIKNLKSIIDED